MNNFDFSSEKLPGSEYGLIRRKDTTSKTASQYRRYPSNVQWDSEDARLMALEIYLHQQRFDLSASLTTDDLLLTSRGVGDGESTMADGHPAASREATSLNNEDSVRIDIYSSENNAFSLQAESLIVSMFCTPDNQILPKEVFLRNASYRQLMAIKIPFYFFVTRVIQLHFHYVI